MSEEIVEGQSPAVRDGEAVNSEQSAVNGTETAELVSDLDPETQLTPGQVTLLTALVGNPSVPLAAKAAGVCRSTAYQWMIAPGFKEELARQRNAMLAATLDAVKTHAIHAAERLAGLVETEDGRLCRLVCNDILERAIRIRELEDFGRRLAAVEKRLNGGGQ